MHWIGQLVSLILIHCRDLSDGEHYPAFEQLGPGISSPCKTVVSDHTAMYVRKIYMCNPSVAHQILVFG